MTTFTRNLMAIATVTLMAGGCAHGNTAMGDVETENDANVIRVTNHNWADMTIYLVRNGFRHRLGTVPSQTTEPFVVPAHLVASASDIYLMADPVGSTRTFMSEPVIMYPGQTAEWQLENSLALSSMRVR